MVQSEGLPRFSFQLRIALGFTSGPRRDSIVSGCSTLFASFKGGVEHATRSATSRLAMNVTPQPTPKQGQYLAFIYYYTKLNCEAPAEADIQRYFRVSPPTVHNMVVTLHERGFISREPGRARSIRILLDRNAIPDLD